MEFSTMTPVPMHDHNINSAQKNIVGAPYTDDTQNANEKQSVQNTCDNNTTAADISQGAVSDSGKFSGKTILENLPQELLTQPRFFPVRITKDGRKLPCIKAWQLPNNQMTAQEAIKKTGLIGMDICGHGLNPDYFFVDFDHVKDQSGNFLYEDAERWNNYLSTAETFSETSISKDGTHYLFCPTPNLFPTLTGFNGGNAIYFDETKKGKDAPKIELFYKSAGRYILLTGDGAPNTEILSGDPADEYCQHLCNQLALDTSQIKNAIDTNETPIDSDISIEEVKKMLAVIPCAKVTYADWFKVAAILHLHFGSAGFELWRAWSETDPKRYTLAACQKQWRYLDNRPNFSRPATIGSLIFFAKKFGYHPPKKSADLPANESLTEEQRAILFAGDLSDLDNARRIEYLFGTDIKFVTNRKQWLTFKNGVWKFSEEGNSAIYPNATTLADMLIANSNSKDEWKIGQHLKAAKHIDSAVKMLSGLNSIRITTDDLNRHNNLLNCKNGVIDLQTGKFYDIVDPKLLITQQTNAAFLEGYHNDIVENFLRDILPDEPTRAALIRFLGYSATGECCEEKALFFNGDGGNGKGTLTKTLILLFGTYAVTLKTSAILLTGRTQDAGAATTELNPLENARLAVIEELPQGGKLDTAKFKNLTGSDFIPIRKLRQEQINIEPHFSPIFSGNYLPELSDTRDNGLLRRLMNIYFAQSFIGNQRDPHLKAKLATPDALSGFLSLIIAAAKEWYQFGLLESSAMKQATRNYLTENDFIGEFIAEHCIRGTNFSIPRKAFLERLKTEYSAECLRLFNNRDRALTDAIKRIDGITYQRGKLGYSFFGIDWNTNKQQSFEDFNGVPVDTYDIPN